MINLLPEQYKLNFATEYRWRVVIVVMAFIDVLIIIGAILLVPSYFYSRVQADAAANQVQSAGQGNDLHAGLIAQTATLSATLSALVETSTEVTPFTQIISTISADKTQSISITSINYNINDPSGGGQRTITLELRGVATTRDSLAAFVANLKGESGISNVKVPISDYAADTSVPFDITLTVS